MQEPIALAVIILILAISIAIIKTIHFQLTIKRKKMKYWFYFDRLSIINSRNTESEKAKKIQNIFTLAFVTVLVIELKILMLIKSLMI